MLQDQMRRKKKAFPKKKPSGEADDVIESPAAEETLAEIDQALQSSKEVLNRAERIDHVKKISDALQKQHPLVHVKVCSC